MQVSTVSDPTRGQPFRMHTKAVPHQVPFGRRMPGLDGIRGAAILSVIAFHMLRVSGQISLTMKPWRLLQESSWAGVDLFFVLSGFLITGVLIDSRQYPGYFRNFYARRTLRIMPLYYFVLAVALIVVPTVLGRSRLPNLYSRLLENQLWVWTYFQNYLQATGAHTLPGFGHFWSLAVEEQFYWVWPLVVYALTRRQLLRVCIAICVLEPVLRIAMLYMGFSTWAIRQYTFTRIDTLLLGGIAAIVIRDPLFIAENRRLAYGLLAIASAILVAIAFKYGFLPYEGKETVVIGYSALGILFSALVFACASGASNLESAVSVPILRWFGRYSYAIYVFHLPVKVMFDATVAHYLRSGSPVLSAVIGFVTVTIVSSGVAWVSWHLFESRFLKLKKYFEYSQEPLDQQHVGGKDILRNNPKNIIHTPEPSDGAALYVCELVKALARTKAPVVLFCPANYEYQSEARKAGVEVVQAPSRTVAPASLAGRILRNFTFVTQTASAQYRLTRRDDIVHFQFPVHLPLGFIFVLLVLVRGGFVVLTAHDPMPHRWRFPLLLRSLERKMLEWFYGLCRCIVVHNQAGRDVLVSQFHQRLERIFVIPHGPLSGNVLGEDSEYPNFDCLRLLLFGSIRENKGVKRAIQAVQKLNSDSRLSVRLTIAGCVDTANEQRHWQDCKRLIAKMPACIDVIEGVIADGEVSTLFARHHAVLLPYSDFYSESGVAALSLSNHRPILATQAGGLGELLEQSGCGIPIESPTPESVAQAIAIAIELGPERLSRMGIAGWKFVTQTRGWESIARKTLAVYAQITGIETLEAECTMVSTNRLPAR